MKHKVSELSDALLDAAVAKALGKHYTIAPMVDIRQDGKQLTPDICRVDSGPGIFMGRFSPSSDWAHGGPIIERERIVVQPLYDEIWESAMPVASWPHEFEGFTTPRIGGSTPLIAAMRCFVASKFGDEVEL